MRDYNELLTVLRACTSKDVGCMKCPRLSTKSFANDCAMSAVRDAADAIEELLAAVRSVVHCKDCEWWTKQEASIQGRCARLAIYPTGEFYCAAGSKTDPPKEVE